MSAIRALVGRLFPPTVDTTVERVAEGVSTRVYRIRRGAETFLNPRVLPEARASLLIAVRALARAAEKNPARIARHQGLVAIRRDLDLLGA